MVASEFGTAVYDYVESWWGEALTASLIARITGAPLEHLEAFEQGWPKAPFFADDPSLPDLQPGRIRPALNSSHIFGREDGGNLEQALRSLLLLPGAVIDPVYLDPFRWLDDGWRSHFTDRYDFDDWPLEMRALLPGRLHLLMLVRPLVEDGSLLVTPMTLDSREGDRSFHKINGACNALAEDLLAMPDGTWTDEGDEYDYRDIRDRFVVARRFGMPIELARNAKATLLARSPFESDVINVALSGLLSDRRTSRVGVLARLILPNLAAKAEDLVRIRQTSDAFEEFRVALSSALDDVGSLDESADMRLATDAVLTNVSEHLARVERATVASPSLTAMREGSTRMTISGVGLAAGAAAGATGNLLGGLAAGAAASGAAVLLKYVEAVRVRRESRLVWDFVMSLRDSRDPG